MAGDWLVQAAALVAEAEGRAAQKRLGDFVDRQPPELREAIVRLARERGIELPDEAQGWAGKRLLRRAQGREGEARTRLNPVRVDEGFVCRACGSVVGPGGRRVRDHCPCCLTGSHVDVVPGDRAASCGALLRAVGLEVVGDRTVLRYQCTGCDHTIRIRSHPDDDPAVLAALSAEAR